MRASEAARMHCAPARLGLAVAFLLVLAIVGGPLLPRSSPSEQLARISHRLEVHRGSDWVKTVV